MRRKAIRCLERSALTIFKDKTVTSRAELRLDSELCPPELAVLLKESIRDQAEGTITPRGGFSSARAFRPTTPSLLDHEDLTTRSEHERASLVNGAREMLPSNHSEPARLSAPKLSLWWWHSTSHHLGTKSKTVWRCIRVLRRVKDTTFYDGERPPKKYE